MIGRVSRSVLAALVTLAPFNAFTQTPERAVAWLRTDSNRFERELNQAASRGLQLAAITDGLPCAFAVLQTPEQTSAQTEYRVVRDRDVGAQLPALIEAGFTPRLSAPGIGARYDVIFEHGSLAGGTWRAVEFANLEDLETSVAAASADGFQARVLVRPPNRSWPGLSSRGMVLMAKSAGAAARDTRVIAGSGRDVKDEAKTIAAATGEGWSIDLLFTSSRDGSLTTRRERMVVVLSRDRSTKPASRPVTLARSSSFGVIGSGIQVASAPFWDEYLFAWTPAERRQLWATPIRLADSGAQCPSIEYQLRLEAPRTQRSTILGAIGKPGPMKGYELVLVIEERFGSR